MAANYKAELKDKESVLQYYSVHQKTPLFVIYTGVSMNNICYEFTDTEHPEQGEDMLNSFLELLDRDVTNTNVYTIQLIDTTAENKGRVVYTGSSLRFQLHTPQPYFANNPKEVIYNNIPTLLNNENNNEVTFLLKNLLEEQKKETERLRELLENNFVNDDDEEEEEEEEPEPPPLTTNQRIAGIAANLMERDEIQEAIAGLIINGQRWLTKKVFKTDENE